MKLLLIACFLLSSACGDFAEQTQNEVLLTPHAEIATIGSAYNEHQSGVPVCRERTYQLNGIIIKVPAQCPLRTLTDDDPIDEVESLDNDVQLPPIDEHITGNKNDMKY